MSFGLRLGTSPRVMVSTTPKPIPLLKRLVKDPTCAIPRGTTYDNRANLAAKFFKDTVARYEGTRLGRQELYADILSDNPDALWQYTQLDALRVQLENCPPFNRIVVAVDPPGSTGEAADECGIIVAGLGDNGHGYVLAEYRSPKLFGTATRNRPASANWNAPASARRLYSRPGSLSVRERPSIAPGF
jgi:phage terminase large subunit-like protein